MLKPLRGLRRESVAEPDLVREAFARSVINGLGDHPRWLSCRYLYDSKGSAIFERITEQIEYYPTRTEAGILSAHAERIRELCGNSALVELGAGSASKTRHLLRAWTADDRAARYVAVDISPVMLSETCATLRSEFPTLTVDSLAGSYEQSLPSLSTFSPLTLLFLGSSVGNFNAEELEEFFSLLTISMVDGDRLLLGIDLVKDVATLEAAYNDAAGWSAAFTLNLFARMNRELGTDLDLDSIEYVARWNAERSHIEMFAHFLKEALVSLPEWNREFRIAAGEMVLVEISRKFHCDSMIAIAAGHRLEHVETFTDPGRNFGLLLLEQREGAGVREAVLRCRLRKELHDQRCRTLELIAPLSPAQMAKQHSRILSPVIWDLGHIANFEDEWINRSEASAQATTLDLPPSPSAQLYDPLLHPRSVRGALPLPDVSTCVEGLAAVRERTDAALEECRFPCTEPLAHDGYVFSMIAQHEAQHSETILQGIQLLPSHTYEPERRADGSLEQAAGVDSEAFVPAGPFVMGTDNRSVAYDNERPSHVVEMDSFWIDVTPVTNAAYLRFIDDGGYRRRELWSNEGWEWLCESRVEHPAQWQRSGEGQWLEQSFGRIEPLAVHRPVIHVCWHEATACARWLGKRLPTEAEWEKAAAWDLERGLPRRYPWGDTPPTSRWANLDQRLFAPSAAGTLPEGRSYFGCHQMIGDVWEWTSSDFRPYPDFRAFPYPEYSEVHFGAGHKVLRGGSWATSFIAIRNTFRNWDLPERRQIFAGLRCARD